MTKRATRKAGARKLMLKKETIRDLDAKGKDIKGGVMTTVSDQPRTCATYSCVIK